MKYYGCGIVIPECIKGLRVLDLGCGAGIFSDAYSDHYRTLEIFACHKNYVASCLPLHLYL